jgi:hypothetical protein
VFTLLLWELIVYLIIVSKSMAGEDFHVPTIIANMKLIARNVLRNVLLYKKFKKNQFLNYIF